MKMVIVSQCPHHLRDGKLVGWGPTLTEISYMASMFDQLVHVAVLYDKPAPQSELPYTADNIRFVGMRPAGGKGLLSKLDVLMQYPRYARTILREVRGADVVQVRAPANVAMLGILLLPFLRTPKRRWIKYAGNWKPDAPESWSYTFQRWLLLRGWHRGDVTVNGQWEDDPPFVHNFINPCLTDQEVKEGRTISQGKVLTSPVRLLFVGRLERAKGVERGLKVVARLRESGVEVKFDLVGDGRERKELEEVARSLGIADNVTFHGWIPRTEMATFYSRAHLLLFPTNSEGWPKVISEAMAYGVVPLTSAVSSIPQFLNKFGIGMALPPQDIEGFANAVHAYLDDPARWADESKRAVDAAARFSYSRFLQDVRDLLKLT